MSCHPSKVFAESDQSPASAWVSRCMRLGDGGPDHVTAYLHAPSRHLTGPWITVPPERVRVGYKGDCIEVVVE